MATVAPRPAKGLEKETAQRLIVVLERASLETVKAGQSFQLLNSDDHAHILKKNNKNAAEYRPDICHQCLMMLLDSPLSKAGKLEVYIHTEANVTIQVLAFSTLVAPPVANVSHSA
jgi:rRNA small subunit pseudouridine methyltransferase Nep1